MAGEMGGGARSRLGARCMATRARNRPFERPTHATVWAMGVVCANECWAAESQCNAWRGPVPRATAVGTEGPHTPIGEGLVAAARRGSRCEGEARELTTRQSAPSATPRRWAGADGGGCKTTEHFANRLIAFLTHGLDSPHRGRAKRSWRENQKGG